MIETIEKDGISITMYLNADRTVDLKKMMTVKYIYKGQPAETKMYPDVSEGKKYGTIQDQFDLVKAVIRFDQSYDFRKSTANPPQN
jgi:hypothetical protein